MQAIYVFFFNFFVWLVLQYWHFQRLTLLPLPPRKLKRQIRQAAPVAIRSDESLEAHLAVPRPPDALKQPTRPLSDTPFLIHHCVSLLCAVLTPSLKCCKNITVGSLNTDILRYNVDIPSTTLKLWGKLDENVSRVNTFPSLSPISLHFNR